MGKIIRYFTQVKSSVADPKLKDADTDPTFNVEADPDPNFILVGRAEFCLQHIQLFFQKP